MVKRIAIVHYTSPPVVGGVETVIGQQARGLAQAGYAVRVVSGHGSALEAPIETHIEPLFNSTHPDVLAVKRELDDGLVSERFMALSSVQKIALERALDGCAVCIVHNLHTLHKNLPLTAAYAAATPRKTVAWCHDLAWTNAQYAAELHDGHPWNLLRTPWPHTHYVTISTARQREMSALLGLHADAIEVIPSGMDAARFLRWTADTGRIVDTYRLLDADGILLLPARITRRKNVELALEVLAALRKATRLDFRLIVTGPPGPHNPSNDAYLSELLRLRVSLGLDEAAHFLYALDDPPFVPDDDTVADLYRLADGLLFPSLQEGFGIPVLEAGLSGLPVFCSALPPFEETAGADASYFDPVHTPPFDIAAQIWGVLKASPAARLRRRVRRDWRWEGILRDHLNPLLEAL